ncbi:uncharacterized protein Z520_08104 [Fonsecaea multimorphosa CBS 102226]|uniref:Amine oxidase domain-containing protein n=1 Tax=Fonsecaea multimorphosa CBS 102226 TaxID=1442371 RepID=A0A0D2IGZ9_9EURO|nr:uncharacterized protein Z520_08104 [Fonsecaea multimorphosa CBS 102226]KIX96326.1 hypothetical protein Z520_08104 [Fonsecaea multimorphosa CBS 102226]OAL21985.1 hypothetical protein AYO22_07582 [Fonsecaea multimorphosa]
MQALRHASTLSSGKIPRVAVIGAGIAGLRCSDVLARSGVKVTLFEARNRIGGRVHQLESGGYLVDMGPNWIHGTSGNPIMHLAERTGTTILEPEEDQALFDIEGKRRSDSEAIELSSKMWEMVVDAFKYSDEHSADIDPGVSLYEYFQSKLDTDEKLTQRQREDLLHEAQMWGPFVGDTVEKQSLKFFFLEECIEGENVFVAGTYKDILKEIGRSATDKGKVDLRLGTEVVHFETGSDDSDKDDGKVTITAVSGEQSTFDEVVITCPLGWLKRHHTRAFTPALPSRLASAISSINYGRLEKLYVTFPSAFWLSPDADGQPDLASYPVHTHFHDPAYVPHASDEAWNQSIVSLAHLPPPCAHPTLLFYIYGPCGTHLVESIKGLTTHSTEYNAVLNNFASAFYSRLPNYKPSSPGCEPRSFLMTTWQADPFAGNGSYCNFQVGLERGDEDIEVMRDAGGLWKKGVWLAGEHTAPFIALGTTTGAWWSGEGVARRICTKWGINVPGDAAVEENGNAVVLDVKKKELDKDKADAANLSGLAI